MRNVIGELPREQHAQTLNLIRVAWKLTDPDEGMKHWNNWRGSWNMSMRRRRAAYVKEWRRCSRSTAEASATVV